MNIKALLKKQESKINSKNEDQVKQVADQQARRSFLVQELKRLTHSNSVLIQEIDEIEQRIQQHEHSFQSKIAEL